MNIPVTKILERYNIHFELIALTKNIKNHKMLYETSLDKYVEFDCKTIITKDNKNNLCALFLKGNSKINFAALKHTLKLDLKILNEQELLERTGKIPGTICPILLKETEIVIDSNVLKLQSLFFSSGDPKYGLFINTEDFLKTIKYKIADFQA